MIRTISSGKTFIIKIIFPLLWLAMILVLVVFLFLGERYFHVTFNGPLPIPIRWVIVGSQIIIFMIIWLPSRKLKRVRMDEQFLYISNYWKEIKVPLQEVADVKSTWWDISGVTVTLRNPTLIGSRIHFMVPFHWGLFRVFSDLKTRRAAMEEIREAVQRAIEH
jgi:hypothetical protein